jgi:hypothetical protein
VTRGSAPTRIGRAAHRPRARLGRATTRDPARRARRRAVEAQAFVAAGHGVTLAHRLNVIINPDRVLSVPLARPAPVRRVQAVVMRNQRAPVVLATLDALQEIGRRRAGASAG